MQWVSDTLKDGDAVIVGQPGSGKSIFVKEFMAVRGDSYFVADTEIDFDSIRQEINLVSPGILIIDNVHSDPNRLNIVMQARARASHHPRMLVSTWPMGVDSICGQLSINRSRCRILEAISKVNVCAMIEEVGVTDNAIVAEIWNQSNGNPGLCVTMALAALQSGGHSDILYGEAIKREALMLIGSDGRDLQARLLAACALGGEAGMKLSTIAASVDVTVQQASQELSRIAAGGIIKVLEQGTRIGVVPLRLAYRLAADYYFRDDPIRLPNGLTFIQTELSPVDAITVLIEIRRLGGDVPRNLIQTLIADSSSTEAWAAFASLGPSEALWALENHETFASSVAAYALNLVPERATTYCLVHAVGDHRELAQNCDHPLRVFDDWLRKPEKPNRGLRILEKRHRALSAVVEWISQSKEQYVGFSALRLVYGLGVEGSELKADGTMVFMSYGYLQEDSVDRLASRWPEVVYALNEISIERWDLLISIGFSWISPGVHSNVSPGPEWVDKTRRTGLEIIKGLVKMCGDHRGVRVKVKASLAWIGEGHDWIHEEPEMSILYPNHCVLKGIGAVNWNHEGLERSRLECHGRLELLAKEKSIKEPPQFWQWLALIIEEASQAGLVELYAVQEDLTIEFVKLVAELVSEPMAWINAFVQNPESVSDDYIFPWILRALRIDAKSVLPGLLALPAVKEKAILALLLMPQVDDDLFSEIKKYPEDIENAARRIYLHSLIDKKVAIFLLESASLETKAFAVMREWISTNKNVRKGTAAAWQEAILSIGLTQPGHTMWEYYLEEILASRRELALDWLLARLQEPFSRVQLRERLTIKVAECLSIEQRGELLARVGEGKGLGSIVRAIVGKDESLYTMLLANRKAKSVHLVPLHLSSNSFHGVFHQEVLDDYGFPDRWIALVRIAVQGGCRLDDIVEAAISPFGIMSWSGSEFEMWTSWQRKFELLKNCEHEEIKELGRIGTESCGRRAAESKLRME